MFSAVSEQPPITVEGWYALHQIFQVDRRAWHALPQHARDRVAAGFAALSVPTGGGWSGAVSLIGSSADVMWVHLRPTLEEVAEVQQALRGEPFAEALRERYSLLSVTEAALYHLSARLASDAGARGGAVGDDQYTASLVRATAEDRHADHVQRRLFPTLPAAMPYVCFYPMSKRQLPGQNWYALPLDARSRLMQAHGATGRRYAGRVVQMITGAIGLDSWDWGITLFAADPLVFKKLVTDMRFDEVTATYAEFGPFFVGRLTPPPALPVSLA
ncbi:MAG: heme-dependent peroxidase [Gemmatimonadaceae bacterium]